MQQFIHENMDTTDNNGGAPTHYSEAEGASYAGPIAYDYPADTSEYIAIDHNLEASTNYGTGEKLLRDSLDGSTALPDQNGHDVGLSANGAVNAHFEPITTQDGAGLNAPAKRKSPDDQLESAFAAGDSKRKRSKVSRACDQCRRKKVYLSMLKQVHILTINQIRCDADAEGANQLKTCSNCQKSGQVCEYSRIPQKRGPSKGYDVRCVPHKHISDYFTDTLKTCPNVFSKLKVN